MTLFYLFREVEYTFSSYALLQEVFLSLSIQSLNLSADQEEMLSVVGSLTSKTKRAETEAVKPVS